MAKALNAVCRYFNGSFKPDYHQLMPKTAAQLKITQNFSSNASIKSEETISAKQITINKLKELFNLSTFAALDIANRHKKLCLTPDSLISANYQICLDMNIRCSTLLKYPEILAQEELLEKIMFLKEIPYGINMTAPLLYEEISKLKIFMRRYKNERATTKQCRIALLSEYFETSKEKVCEALLRKPFLRTIDLARVEKNVRILEEFGINKEAIKRDYWVLRYDGKVISQRLSMAKGNKIDDLKTWMVRSKPEILATYVKRRSENKSILGDDSIAQYLSKRLECSIDQAQVMIVKHPALKHKSMKKMEEIINFLYAKGFKPLHLCRVPKILLHSVETTKKRLKEFESLGLKLESLHILTKSQKQYMQSYDLVVKSIKKGIKSEIVYAL